MMQPRILWAILASVALSACSGGRGEFYDTETVDTLTHHAAYLTISERPDGVVIADIGVPWLEGKPLSHYALVHRDSVLPDNLPSDAVVIRTPLNNVAAYSSVYTTAMAELGVLDAVKAVADIQYFTPGDTILDIINEGKIANLGAASQPSVELIAANNIEVVFRSPMQDMASASLPKGVNTIECADYLETSPIGRAEWLLFFGELFGEREKARHIFDNVIDEYSRLVFLAGGAQSRKPRLLVETETSGVWYVPAGESYAARLYADAGANYIWDGTKGSGSLPLSLEEVAVKALDADLWLVRSYGYETTSETLKALNPRYASFKALKDGQIYSCDSSKRNIFDEGAFHPERLLREYIAIFHPELLPDYNTQYFLRQK